MGRIVPKEGPHTKMPFIPMHEYELAPNEPVPEELWQMWHRLYRVVLFFQKETLILQDFRYIQIFSQQEKRMILVQLRGKREKEYILNLGEAGRNKWLVSEIKPPATEETPLLDCAKIWLIFL